MTSKTISKLEKMFIFLVILLILNIFAKFVISNIFTINKNQAVISLIFAGVLAFATIFYVILTYKLVSETRQMKENQVNPEVIVSLRPRPDIISFIDIVVENIGNSAAFDIKFNFKSDFEYEKGKFLSELSFMKRISYLAPTQKIQSFLTSLLEDFNQKIKSQCVIDVTYKNRFHKFYHSTIMLNMRELKDLRQVGEPPENKIAKEIETISKNIAHLTSGFNKLQVITQTKKEKQKEERKNIEKIKERIKKQGKK